MHFHLGNGYDLAAFHHFSQPWFVAHPYPMNFYTSQEVARLAVNAGFWLEDLKDELRVTARKTGRAGVADQVAALAALTDPAQRLARLRSATRRRRNPRGPGG